MTGLVRARSAAIGRWCRSSARWRWTATIEAYNLPLGCVAQLYRDIAARRAGLLTRVGLRTFVDPRQDGGKINARTTEDLVELMEIDGEEWLLYKAFPIDVALDPRHHGRHGGQYHHGARGLDARQPAGGDGGQELRGLVIAQVERIAAAKARSIRARCRCRACWSIAWCWPSRRTTSRPMRMQHNARLLGPAQGAARPRSRPCRSTSARSSPAGLRCELPPGGVVNLGIGMPEGVAAVAAEEKVLDFVTLTAEPGVIGGMPQGGLDFGAAINPEAVIQQNQQFDFYDGGGLDLACLGMAQADARGQRQRQPVRRPARRGRRLHQHQPERAQAGVCRHVHGRRAARSRSRTARCGSSRKGARRKFIERGRAGDVQRRAGRRGGAAGALRHRALRVPAHRGGLELAEVAPGIDIERDILAHMEFRPIVRDPVPMDARLFRAEPMGLEQILLGSAMADRISFDPQRNTLFINYEGFAVRTTEDVELVRHEVESRCRAVGHRIAVIVNYDGFTLDPAVSDFFFSMIAYLQQRYYTTASRYTTSAFMRMKLGAGLTERELGTACVRDTARGPGERRWPARPADAACVCDALMPPLSIRTSEIDVTNPGAYTKE